jgi:hypothetical protein
MPGTTATQGLIYPVGTDRACDGASQLEVLAKGINGRFTVLDGLADTGEETQMALVEWVSAEWTNDDVPSEEPISVSPIGIVWNRVTIDTADAYDQGISSIALNLPYTAPGQLWEIGCFVEGEWETPPAVEAEYIISLSVYDSAGNIIFYTEENKPNRPTGGNQGGGSIVALYETSGNDSVRAMWSGFINNTPHRLVFGQLWAIRVSEV